MIYRSVFYFLQQLYIMNTILKLEKQNLKYKVSRGTPEGSNAIHVRYLICHSLPSPSCLPIFSF